MEHGGYVEALARVAFLLMRKGEPAVGTLFWVSG